MLHYNDAVESICQNYPSILLVRKTLFAKLQKKPDKKTEVKLSLMADTQTIYFYFIVTSVFNCTGLYYCVRINDTHKLKTSRTV